MEVFVSPVYPSFFATLKAGIYPGMTRNRNFCEFCTTSIPVRTRNFCEFCKTFIPVPETSVSSVRQCHNTQGTGTASLYLPGTCVSSVRPCHNTRNFWKFCTWEDFHTRTRNFCKFCTPVPQYPELLLVLKHFHTRTRNFWKLCKTPIPLPEIHKPYRT